MLKNKITKSLALVLVFMLLTSLTVFADVSKGNSLDEISTDNILKHLNALAIHDDARIAGSDGERAAADYIEKLFKDAYELDQVEKPEFDTIIFYDNGATLTVPADIELTTNGALNMEFTTSGTVSGELVYAGLGTLEECISADVNGKIALIKRGEYYFSEKVQNAADAGAVGVILFNNIMEEGFINGTLGSESVVPAIEIHPVDGEKLAAILIGGTAINVTMSANGT
ncbi:MAG: PA domain-containing protein, partial [Clostridiaceae bacterium]